MVFDDRGNSKHADVGAWCDFVMTCPCFEPLSYTALIDSDLDTEFNFFDGFRTG